MIFLEAAHCGISIEPLRSFSDSFFSNFLNAMMVYGISVADWVLSE